MDRCSGSILGAIEYIKNFGSCKYTNTKPMSALKVYDHMSQMTDLVAIFIYTYIHGTWYINM